MYEDCRRGLHGSEIVIIKELAKLHYCTVALRPAEDGIHGVLGGFLKRLGYTLCSASIMVFVATWVLLVVLNVKA